MLNIKYKRREAFLILFALLIIIFRKLDLFISPRFWAEEAVVYFDAAFNNGWKALFYGHQGYFSLTPNLATYLASKAPLYYAPNITLVVSLLVMLLPAILIAKNKALNLSFATKTLAILAIYFTANTEEVWLNTINSQFWFVIISFLLLIAVKKQQASQNKAFYLLAFISGLSGVPANLIAPFFLLKYYYYKNKADLIIFLIFCLTIGIQLFYIKTLASSAPERTLLNLELLISSLSAALVYGLGGSFIIGKIGGFILAIGFFIIAYKNIKEPFLKWPLVLPIYLYSIMAITSLEMQGGARYLFAPAVIFTLIVIYTLAHIQLVKKERIYLLAVLCLIFTAGIKNYPFSPGNTTHPSWPKWKEQIRLHEAGKLNSILIYPIKYNLTLKLASGENTKND